MSIVSDFLAAYEVDPAVNPKDYGFEGWLDLLVKVNDLMDEMDTTISERIHMSKGYKHGRVPDIEVDVRQRLARVLGYGYEGDSAIVMLGASVRIERLVFEIARLRYMIRGDGNEAGENPN